MAEIEQQPNDLLSVLMDMRSGQVAADINAKFNEMVSAVLDTAAEGELIIKLKVKPSKMGTGGAVLEVETKHECKMKKPELEIGRSVFFVGEDGRLTRDDPKQVDMFATTAVIKEKR